MNKPGMLNKQRGRINISNPSMTEEKRDQKGCSEVDIVCVKMRRKNKVKKRKKVSVTEPVCCERVPVCTGVCECVYFKG